MKSIGVDIGGTKIAGALVDDEGRVLAAVHRPSSPDNPDQIVETVGEIVRELSDPDTLDTVGVAVAAFLNRERTHVYFSPNITWPDFPVKSRLEDVLSRRVVVENDANAAGWAEYQCGAGADARSLIMLTLGTGVGGAIIEDGRLLIGAFGAGGELGHLVVEPDGKPCGCGNRGCLEQYASGTALMEQMRHRAGDESMSSEDALRLFESGDSGAREVFHELADVIAKAMTSLVAMMDPEVVVVGGGVAKAGAPLVDLISERFRHHYPAHTRRPTARIALAHLGNMAGAVGAADLARRNSPAKP